MKRRERMNNLWIIAGRASAATFIHSARLRSGAFVPI